MTMSAEKAENGAAPGQRPDDMAIAELVKAKTWYLGRMFVIYMVGYVGVTVLAGFAKGFMGIKIIGAVNLGFVLIFLNYLLAWALAIAYQRIANSVFDPLVARAKAATKAMLSAQGRSTGKGTAS